MADITHRDVALMSPNPQPERIRCVLRDMDADAELVACWIGAPTLPARPH
ncbi:MAG: hypothetical protein ACI82G_003088, partial [Bradymonadia bacterium]